MYLDFLENEIPIFPIYPIVDGRCSCSRDDCDNAGKHPLGGGWQNTPLWSDDQLEFMEETDQLDGHYGVLVSAGLLVVDVDARNGGAVSYEKLAEDIPELGGAGLVVNTGSGGGSRHLYFKTDGRALVQSLDKYPGIDFKSTGYVVGPGSMHASGRTYEVAIGAVDDIGIAPDSLLAALERPSTHRTYVDGVATDISDDELAQLVMAIPNGDQTDYEVFIRVGMAIHHTTGGVGEDLWHDWAKKSGKYDPSEMDIKWHSFGKSAAVATLGTLKHYAAEAGWVEPVTFTPTAIFSDDDDHQADPLNTMGIDLQSPPGFVGQLTKWIDGQCRYPRQHLAVAAALVAVSNAAGMRYVDPLDGITPNLFAFGVAGSGTGKEAILRYCTELHKAAGVAPAVHGGIKSEQELFRNLIRHQASNYLIDEIGEMLSKVSNARKKGTSAYLEGIIGQLLSLYSKANSFALITGDLKEEVRNKVAAEIASLQKRIDNDIDAGKDPSDRLEREVKSLREQMDNIDQGIPHPYLSIFGLTTPERFRELMDYDMAANGFVGRSLIFQEAQDNPRSRGRNKRVKGGMPQDIAAAMMQLYAPGYSDITERVCRVGDVVELPTTDDAVDLLDEIVRYFEDWAERESENGMTAIPRRGYELVAKVSMILGIPEGLRTKQHVKWAFALVKRDIEGKIRMVRSTDTHDKAGALESAVLSCMSRDTPATLGVIRNRCRKFTPADVEKMADWLVERGMASCEEVPAKRSATGKTKKYLLTR